MAILSLILYYACPNTPYHVTAATVLAKLYSNSVLAIFNARIRIVGGRDGHSDGGADTENAAGKVHLSLHPTGLGLGLVGMGKGASGGSQRKMGGGGADAIRVQEDVYVHADEIPLEVQVRFGPSSNPFFLSLLLIAFFGT